MYSNRNNLIIGFHGCDKEVRDSLLNHPNKIQISEKPYDWLGHGIYFGRIMMLEHLNGQRKKKKGVK